nr:MAG TPA: hypothetical protein [Caudoviricetes sp.]
MARFIFDLPNEELLPLTFDLVAKIDAFKAAAKAGEQLTAQDGETKKEFAKRKLMDLAKKACVEHPKEASVVSDAFWLVDDGEKAPNAIITFNKVLSRDDVMSFFVSLSALA